MIRPAVRASSPTVLPSGCDVMRSARWAPVGRAKWAQDCVTMRSTTRASGPAVSPPGCDVMRPARWASAGRAKWAQDAVMMWSTTCASGPAVSPLGCDLMRPARWASAGRARCAQDAVMMWSTMGAELCGVGAGVRRGRVIGLRGGVESGAARVGKCDAGDKGRGVGSVGCV